MTWTNGWGALLALTLLIGLTYYWIWKDDRDLDETVIEANPLRPHDD